MPTLGLQMGVEYVFKQGNETNHWHPLGFAYFPDGAHKDVDELEPGISQTGSACVEDESCQTPLYYLNGEFLGNGSADFGLDNYEPDFFLPRQTWIEQGEYEVRLTLDEPLDTFYFCHIHNEMSGRIKVVDEDGNVMNATDYPPLGYEYDTLSEVDVTCGTTGLGNFTEAGGLCTDTFLCLEGTETEEQQLFAECLYAVDCQMDYEMRTHVHDENPVVSFIHQMIPHHVNAINMAKLLLKHGGDDLDGDMVDIAWDIINGQNHQIDTMQAYLDAGNYESSNDAICVVDGGGGCTDSATWHKVGEDDKNCDWVAQWQPRCDAKGMEGDLKTLASDSCPRACGIC